MVELFLCFLQVGLLSIGGGYAAIPLIQGQVVTHHGWLTLHEFTDLVTLAEMTPGPIAVNAATFVGIRICGVPGAVVATLGCILPSCLIVSLLAWVYRRWRQLPALQQVLGSLRPAVVALIAGAGLSILGLVAWGGGSFQPADLQWSGIALFAAAFFCLRKFKWNPIAVMALCGAARLGLGLIGI